MSEITDIATLEIKPEQAPTLYVPNGLDTYLDHIREMAKEAPDVTTAKGRDRIGSLARQVGSSKTAIEKPGRDYLRRLKEAVKPAEEELRRFTRECDAIRDAILAPRIEWEAEQERLKAEEEARIAAEKFAAELEEKHEQALILNKLFDIEAAQKAEEAERQRIAHEEELKRLAAEQAKQEAEEAAQREREEAAAREAVLKAQAEQAERDRIAAQERAEREAKEAREKAEREKQEAIAEAQRKAQEEADRIKREAEQKEAARLAEEKRIADESAARAANEAHRKVIGTAVVKGLMEHAGLTREQAISTLSAIKDNKIPHTSITY